VKIESSDENNNADFRASDAYHDIYASDIDSPPAMK